MNNQVLIGILNLVVALFTTMSFVPKLNKIGNRFKLFDKPDKRKRNKENMVRIGGVALFAGFLISQLITFSYLNLFDIENNYFATTNILFFTGLCFFSLIGLFEDLLTLSPTLRLFLQTIVMTIIWQKGFGIEVVDISFLNLNLNEITLIPLLSYVMTFLWIVGITNAMNWLDGLDGLLGGVALINFLGIAFISFSLGDLSVFYFSLSLVGCCIGFLIYNFYPSKIFMGDSGSYFLGFSLASLSLLTFSSSSIDLLSSSISLHKSFLLVIVPVIDMFLVVCFRVSKGVSPLLPDRSHLHFRILDTNKSVPSTVRIIYCLVLFFTLVSCYLVK